MNRPLRIGFDVAQTCQERAGCGWYADSLAHALVAAEPENEYYLYHHFGAWFNERTDAGTRIGAPRVHSPLRDLSLAEAAAFLGELRASGAPLPGEPDIVHANSYQAPPTGGARQVFTVYDVSYWVCPEFTTDGNRLHCQDGIFAALERADGFLFISESSRRQFEGILPGWLERHGKPWAVTHLGQREHPQTVEPLADRDFWLAVGTLEPRKNYETLLDALDLYWSRSPRPLPLRIAGGGGWKSDALKAHLTTLEAQGRVERLGYVPDADLLRLYASARALVFPSWHEGFGLPVLEALGQGTPVICSDRASLPEVGGEAAVYVDPGSAESICQAMLALEADPERRARLAQAGREQAARFSWEKTARETLAFYRRVLARDLVP
ncbi:MAG: glycosyltransferase family 4 protein [Gluconacetobacter diazotrophicus]|nr:glycosyltransferase family 4 protein [Gluconacetobacter diazotrophicus]